MVLKAPACAGVRMSGVKRRLMEHSGGGGRLGSTPDGFGKVSVFENEVIMLCIEKDTRIT